jgi:DUF1680 family protein
MATQIDNEFRRGSSSLYSERTNLNGDRLGGINGYAFIWAAATQFRVRNSVLAADFNSANEQRVLTMSDHLQLYYWDRSSDHQNGYVVAPGSTERYYDDNAHMVVALAEAYELTGEQRLLDRAIATHDFVLEGEDNYQGGGIYFREGSGGNKNTISTLQEARGAAMLYQATGQQRFLNDATRLLDWTNSHVQRSDGLYYQDYRVTGIDHISNVPLTNGAGMGILTNLEMYDITHEESYLTEARRVGARASQNFAASSNGRISGAGYWAFELVDAWVDLYEHDGDPRWLDDASRAVEFLKTNLEDNNGRYGLDWNAVNSSDLVKGWPVLTEWDLINQAAVARAFLHTGLAEPPGPAGDLNGDGQLDRDDWAILSSSSYQDLSDMSFKDRYLHGDLDRDGDNDFQDFREFKSLYIAAHGTTAFAELQLIPEPLSAQLVVIAWAGLLCGRSRFRRTRNIR